MTLLLLTSSLEFPLEPQWTSAGCVIGGLQLVERIEDLFTFLQRLHLPVILSLEEVEFCCAEDRTYLDRQHHTHVQPGDYAEVAYVEPAANLLRFPVLHLPVQQARLKLVQKAVAIDDQKVGAGDNEKLIRQLQPIHPSHSEGLSVANVNHLSHAHQLCNQDLGPGEIGHKHYQNGEDLPAQHEQRVVETGCRHVRTQVLHETPVFAREVRCAQNIPLAVEKKWHQQAENS